MSDGYDDELWQEQQEGIEGEQGIHNHPFDWSVWKRLAAYTRPYRREVTILGVSALGVAVADLALPLVTRAVIDDLGTEGRELPLMRYGTYFWGIVVMLAGCVLTFIWMAGRIRTSVSHDIRRDGFRNLQNLSFSYYDHRPVGWLMARMTSDCERLSNILAWGFLDLIWGTATMLGVVSVMLWLHWKLALIVLSVIPVLILVSLVFQKRILKSARSVRRANSRLTGAYNEGLMGVRTSKVFGREEANLGEFQDLSGEMYTSSVRNALQSALFLPIVMSLGGLATGLALQWGGISVVGGALSIGTLVAFLTYGRHFFEPVQELSRWFAELQMAQASAERVLGLIAAEPEIQDSAAVQGAVRAQSEDPVLGRAIDGGAERIGRITFEGVGFSYRKGPKILDDFNLDVPPGETIALVGSTGGGKSTILGLLCRFYEPTEGRVLLNGVDARERSLHWLQSSLGIVLQTPHLFSGTVAENIRYGRLEATEEEIADAARLVGAHEFIEGLDDGYSTPVGEGGGRLSMGQKQLISFARAVLADPEILVMDEATSSVDTETEQRIQEALAKVTRGRTCFVIAHRLSTIRSSDRIAVIEAGKIVEIGSHRELLTQRGRYHELYTQQSLRESGRSDGTWSPTTTEPGMA